MTHGRTVIDPNGKTTAIKRIAVRETICMHHDYIVTKLGLSQVGLVFQLAYICHLSLKIQRVSTQSCISSHSQKLEYF